MYFKEASRGTSKTSITPFYLSTQRCGPSKPHTVVNGQGEVGGAGSSKGGTKPRPQPGDPGTVMQLILPISMLKRLRIRAVALRTH